jgi:signal peptidase II
VVDFIDYNGWFIGNVADIALVCGAVWLVVLSCRKPERAGLRLAKRRAERGHVTAGVAPRRLIGGTSVTL